MVCTKIHVVVLNIHVGVETAGTDTQSERIEAAVLKQSLAGDVPSQSSRGRESLTLAFGQAGRPRCCQRELSIVLLSVVVRQVETEVSIARLVVFTRYRALIAVGQQHGADVVNATECAVVIEMSVEGNRLIVGRAAHVLHTRLLVNFLMAVERENQVGTIIVAPCGVERSIAVVVRCRIGGGIVNGNHSAEAQALQQRAEVGFDTCVELELTTCPSALTGCIVVGKDVGEVGQRATEEILSVDDVHR